MVVVAVGEREEEGEEAGVGGLVCEGCSSRVGGWGGGGVRRGRNGRGGIASPFYFVVGGGRRAGC